MITLTQHVAHANVTAEGEMTGEIGVGFLVLLGVEKDDDKQRANCLCEHVLDYRIFSDTESKTNPNVQQAGSNVLTVFQFTLAANTERGMCLSFSKNTSPDRMEALYDYFAECCRQQETNTQTRCFTASMQVPLVNDDPMTF